MATDKVYTILNRSLARTPRMPAADVMLVVPGLDESEAMAAVNVFVWSITLQWFVIKSCLLEDWVEFA